MFLPGCDAILDSSIWGHARYVYVSNLCLLYLCIVLITKSLDAIRSPNIKARRGGEDNNSLRDNLHKCYYLQT